MNTNPIHYYSGWKNTGSTMKTGSWQCAFITTVYAILNNTVS